MGDGIPDQRLPLLPRPTPRPSTPFTVTPPEPVVEGYTAWVQNSSTYDAANGIARASNGVPTSPYEAARVSSNAHSDLSWPLPVPWVQDARRQPSHSRTCCAGTLRLRLCWTAFSRSVQALCCAPGALGAKVFPCLTWLPSYPWRQHLLADALAGVAVAVMLIPQAMSYASIAGLPHQYGLYGSLAPVLAYAVFGSSRHLAVGPAAVTSLLISNGLREQVPGYIAANISNPNELLPEQVAVQAAYNQRAIQLSMLVGLLYSSCGLFRLGFLTNFLSHSVISGFTSGSAIIIAVTQMKYFLGYQIQATPVLHQQLWRYWQQAHLFRWQELLMGCSLLAVILTMKNVAKQHKGLRWLRPMGPITVCVLGKALVWVGDLRQHGIVTLDAMTGGLPKVTVSWWLPLHDLNSLLPLAGVVMLVDLMESTSIARAISLKTGQTLDSNQEILGLGVANLVGAACNSYTTTGSFSRSAVNYDSGAKTQVSGLASALVVGLFLTMGMTWFDGLPKNAIGAVVVNSVTGLVEFGHARHLYKVNRLDFVVWICSFLTTLFVGVEVGLVISVSLALLFVIYHSAFPHTAVLGRIPHSRVYRNVEQYPDAVQVPGMLIVRVDAPLYFANIAWVQERLCSYLEAATQEAASRGTAMRVMAMDLSPVSHTDAAGVRFLHDLITRLRARDVDLALCNPNQGVVAALERGGVLSRLTEDWVFVRVHDAVLACRRTASVASGLDGLDRGATGAPPGGEGGDGAVRAEQRVRWAGEAAEPGDAGAHV